MYDENTLEFIKTAKALENLDLEELPQRLTAAYAEIVTARLRMAEGDRPSFSKEWTDFEGQFRRMATTYEVLTLLLAPDDARRASTAFVSASAHHARARVAEVLGGGQPGPELDRWSLAPKVSAALLYIIGGHQADAAELGHSWTKIRPANLAETVVQLVGFLVSGTGDSLARLAATFVPAATGAGELDDQACEVLLTTILKGLKATALQLLGREGNTGDRHYERVIEMTQAKDEGKPWSAFSAPGIRHLALMLQAAAEHMVDCAVVTLPTPSGVDQEGWKRFLCRYATERPLLWRNHRKALANGLLEAGKSAVISFPTGAGKSALAEFRCATEFLRRRKVIYLVPTRALVSQVRKQLSDVLKDLGKVGIQGYLGEDAPDLRHYDIAVMTPEACLLMAGALPELTNDVGLVIFDECHLLSGSTEPATPPQRRAVDASLALLGLVRLRPDADLLLLSAMVANGDELASWIEGITGRCCLASTDSWKPTRQVRGMLAYPKAEIEQLTKIAGSAKRKKAKKAPIEREMQARPWGLFCHQQAWKVETSYHTIPMLNHNVRLGLSPAWKLTANRNQVAAQLAAAFVRARIRPLVFIQNITHLSSSGKATAEILSGDGLEPGRLDKELLELASLELGDPLARILPPGNLVGLHHALLLPTEREAVERAFKTGLHALFATPTLAQGMNLPAEIVIIAGDDRWEDDDDEEGSGKPVILAVHEVLNAAGRAGRAGMFAQGLVFVIPSKVFTVEHLDDDTFDFDGLEHAASLLGSPDQCLTVTDPLLQVMDLASQGGHKSEVCQYFLQRIRHGREGDPKPSRDLLRASLGYHQAVEAGHQQAFEALIEENLRLAGELSEDPAASDDLQALARTLGVSPVALKQASDALPADTISLSVVGWAGWILDHWQKSPLALPVLLHLQASGLTRIFKRDKSKSESPNQRFSRMCQGMAKATPIWMAGGSLKEIEPALFEHSRRDRQVDKFGLARRFHNETAPALGLVGYVIRRLLQLRDGEAFLLTIQLEALPGCLSGGFDQPQKLALYEVISKQRTTCRREVHQIFAELDRHVPCLGPAETMRNLRSQMRTLARQFGHISA